MPIVKGIIGQRTKQHVNYVPPSYVINAFQGPTAEGRLSDLLFTDADAIDILYVTSTRDYIIRTNLRLCNCK